MTATLIMMRQGGVILLPPVSWKSAYRFSCLKAEAKYLDRFRVKTGDIVCCITRADYARTPRAYP